MPKAAPRKEPDPVLAQMADYPASHPHGVALEALSAALKGSLPRRTLQRRVAALVAKQHIFATGAGRGVRYRLATRHAHASAGLRPLALRAPGDYYLPLSPGGEQVKTYVRQALHQRRPVAYDITFLEAYAPNRSAYLAPELRAQLHSLGSPDVAAHAPAGTFAREIFARLLIDLSWASSTLEGNTYTRLDTQRLIEFGQAADGKDAFETQMILNHKAAIEYLVGETRVAVDAASVTALHALLSDGLLRDPRSGGRVRKRAVEIGGSVYRPLAMPQRLLELFDITLHIAAEITDPFEQGFFLMVHLPYLQPFEDVNKRVSRLAANIPLLRHNLCPLSFIDVPPAAYVDAMLGVYELARVDLLRDVFVWAYERSCQQYAAVRQQLVAPDTFRLRYRAELGVAIKAIVQLGTVASDRRVAKIVPSSVPRADRARFMALLRGELEHLHEGNAIRFGLRPLEIAAWRKATLT